MIDDSALKLLEIDNASEGILAYSVDSGDISDEVATIIWKRFDDAKAAGSKIRIYAEMSAMPKISGDIVMEKLKRLGTILSTVERFVIVGDAAWMDIYAKIVNPITRYDVKHFPSDQKEAARSWLMEGKSL
ncbi:MAG: STAS/SEC14 domain-containing protein [Desulfobulbaceae bacterium]|nr:MAG: STAS/SEC14 domain-containing protein [Desulfobulbaceae bacterium]